ncbi:MAG TPA: hypothetical protein PLD12_10805 [Bacteroidales bacterium]|nr:hypothetical protein [Bacteroidales bacterium]HOK99619.1 hypothetical protein [Bacteroidales bacterium]HPO66451.1 hypothetical protein [Bacteroidales bacterium]
MEKRIKWLTWTVIVLAVMIISTWGTIIYNRYFASTTTAVATQMPQENINLSGRFFREQLNWNDQQMAQFRVVHPRFRQEVQYILNNLQRNRNTMFEVMKSDPCDTLRLNELSDSIGYWHSRLKKATYRYFLDLKYISTPEQRQQLEQIFSRLLTNEMPAGMGGGHRHRRQQPMFQYKNQN